MRLQWDFIPVNLNNRREVSPLGGLNRRRAFYKDTRYQRLENKFTFGEKMEIVKLEGLP